MTTTDQQLLAHVRLARSTSVGPITFHKLVNQYGSAAAAIEALLDGPNAKKVCSLQIAERELDNAAKAKMSVSIYGSDTYPYRLADIPDAPPVLYYKGDASLFDRQLCAIVGARNASGAGLKLTNIIASELGKNGVGVVSGLARGIDTAAHHATDGSGTIACLAGGLDVVYPEENRDLYRRVIKSGLIVSEMPPGTKPQARHFPRRNRIISGLSGGVLIIEAAARSGSLITARFAAEQGRDIFAVPGSPLDPRSAGGNQLLKDGAILVRGAEDIIHELAAPTPPKRPFRQEPVEAKSSTAAHPVLRQNTTNNLLALLNPSPIHIDEIVALSGLAAKAVVAELQLLEIDGKITRHSGGRFSRIE